MDKHRIVEHIPADRYISRKDLCEASGYSDRRVRQLIEDARRSGAKIVSNTHSGGYKIAANDMEWRDFVLREQHRAIATYKRFGVPQAQMEWTEVQA